MPLDDDPDRQEQPGIKDLISLNGAAKQFGLSQGHLALLIRRGELWGIKIGRNWVTTEKAVREYLARGLHPGARPTKTPKQSPID